MENENTMPVVEEMTDEETEECYPRLRDAIKASKLGRFVARHKVGVGVGVGTTVAAIAAAVAAGKSGFVEITDVSDAVESAVDAVTDVAE